MTVTVDIIDGARARKTLEGMEVPRVAIVRGLTGTPAQRIISALSAPGIPRLGSEHPYAPGALLDDIDAEAIDNDTAQLNLTYRTPRDASGGGGAGAGLVLGVELTASTVTEKTSVDATGQKMLNSFIGWSFGLVIIRKQVEVDVLRPQLIVRINHKRRSIPKTLATDYIGTVNSDRWSGYSPGTWLCTNFSARREQGQWLAMFEAAYKATGWRVTDAIEINGQVPESAVAGNGLATFDVYARRRFAGLNISF